MGYPPKPQEYYSLDYLLRYSTFSPMLSVVFRNHAEVAPDWIKKAPFGDMIVHAGNLLHGTYGFIDDVMGSYRIHSGGLASGTSRLNNVRVTLEVYRLLGKNFNLSDRPAFSQGILALKISYFAEWLMQIFLPRSFKKYFDTAYGAKIRSIIRKILTHG